MPSKEAKTNSRRVKTLRSIFFLLLALPLFAAQQTINTGTNPNAGAGDSLRTAFTKVNANFTDLYNTAVFSNSIIQWSTLTNTPATLAGYGITNGITAATAASTYAPIASPTFTGTVTIPSGASISGYLTTTNAASTYAPLASPTFTGTVTIPSGASIAGFAPLASPALTGTPTVPTASVDTSTTQAASTAFVLGQAASATPLINGTAAVGTSTRYARGDHVHPTDTSRAPLASPTFTGTVAVTGGQVAASSPVLNLTQTWTNSGVTYTGELLNITDTASNAASLLQDWQVGGVSKTSLRKDGLFKTSGAIQLGSSLPLTWGSFGSIWSDSDAQFRFSNNAGTANVYEVVEAQHVLSLRSGANAQSFRVYNTYTDASNYERAVFDWTTTASTLTIGSAKAGTGSSRAVNFVAGGVTALTLGTAGDVQLPKTITAAGTTGAQTINKASGSVNLAAAATSLVVTDSLVTTSSIIILTVAANDATCKSVSYVPANGSFTIYPNAAPTAETRVNFLITN